MPTTLLWLKRDLRWTEHPAFDYAKSLGHPIYPFFLWEPEWEQDPTTSERHLRFVWESIQELSKSISPKPGKVFVHRDSALPFFEKIFREQRQIYLVSHREMGNARTFNRDQMVANLCKEYGIEWTEVKQQFCLRGLKRGRKDWPKLWKEWMESPLISNEIKSYVWVQQELAPNFEPNVKSHHQFQTGGERHGLLVLEEFLETRVRKYSPCISKPEESRIHCSRLSPYLAWGNISAKFVYQQTKKRRATKNKYIQMQMDRFLSRLFWRDHMIQKFESECRMESENFNRAFDSLEKKVNLEFIQAWEAGETGFPLVDACMKALVTTGYLNFRMRAMLVSFFTMILWQDWRLGTKHLGRMFLDFEPGIHYFQFQMQAGTVGMHQLRIYNPYKQSLENDPNASFIRNWIPEFAHVPIPEIHTWGKELSLFNQAKRPLPIVDLDSAIRRAKEIHFAFQKSYQVQKENQRIQRLHVNS